jgi:hypothetical protein
LCPAHFPCRQVRNFKSYHEALEQWRVRYEGRTWPWDGEEVSVLQPHAASMPGSQEEVHGLLQFLTDDQRVGTMIFTFHVHQMVPLCVPWVSTEVTLSHSKDTRKTKFQAEVSIEKKEIFI